jgi:hypothetical protein
VFRFDDNPPSPAPANDRYVLGGHHFATTEHRYSTMHHRTMSPSSRYRSQTSITDMRSNYTRDISPKCDRFVTPPPGHFLANSTPMASNENYPPYLTSNVHTPVKRYIPTPPPSETYSQSSSQSAGNTYTLPSIAAPMGNGVVTRQHAMNTIPYRFRMKCCAQEPMMGGKNDPTSLPPSVGDYLQHDADKKSSNNNANTDHYATPPRVRPLKCSSVSSSSVSISTNSQVRKKSRILKIWILVHLFLFR